MPSHKLAEFIHRLRAVEDIVQKHLTDGVGVIKTLEKLNTDVAWIKRAFWALVTLGTLVTVATITVALNHVRWH